MSIRSERRRFFKRRLIRWLLGVVVLVLVGVAVGFLVAHSKLTPAALAKAEAKAHASYVESYDSWLLRQQDCSRSAPTGTDQENCDWVRQEPAPDPELFSADLYLKPQFNFATQFRSTLIAWASIVTVMAFFIGSSFIGAEWQSGSMVNLLVWRARRVSLLATKLGVLLGCLAAVSVATFLLWTGSLWFTAMHRGSTAGMTTGLWRSFELGGLRGVGIALVAGALGFGLASLGRHTALPMAIVLLVIFGIEVGLSTVLKVIRVPFFDLYLPSTYVQAWVEKEKIVRDEFACVNAPPGCEVPIISVTWQHTAVIMMVLLVLVLVPAFVQFQRRDIH